MLPTFIEQIRYNNGKVRNITYYFGFMAVLQVLGVAPEDGKTTAVFRIIPKH